MRIKTQKSKNLGVNKDPSGFHRQGGLPLKRKTYLSVGFCRGGHLPLRGALPRKGDLPALAQRGPVLAQTAGSGQGTPLSIVFENCADLSYVAIQFVRLHTHLAKRGKLPIDKKRNPLFSRFLSGRPPAPEGCSSPKGGFACPRGAGARPGQPTGRAGELGT
jgi:hypothetical protein